MKIAQKYSHLNGEEYLVVHHKKLYDEIEKVIEGVDATKLKTKRSKEKTMRGRLLYSPKQLNEKFKEEFRILNWNETRYQYYITTNRNHLDEIVNLPYEKQKEFLNKI